MRQQRANILFPLSYSQRVLAAQPGALMAYWPLSEQAGAVAYGQILERHGATSGALVGQPGMGDGGMSYLFDGVNDFVNIYSAALTAALVASGAAGTIALWFQVGGSGTWTDGTLREAIRLRPNSNNYIILFKSSTNGFLTAEYNAAGTDSRVDIGSQSATTWTHLAMTWDKATDQLKLYVGGVQVGPTTTGLGTWNATATLTTEMCIGAGTTAATRPWDGKLAHVAVWSAALAAPKITQLAVING